MLKYLLQKPKKTKGNLKSRSIFYTASLPYIYTLILTMNITAALHQPNTGLHCKFHQISFSEHANNKIFLYFNLYCKMLKRTRTLHLSIKFTVGQSFCYFTLCLFFPSLGEEVFSPRETTQ